MSGGVLVIIPTYNESESLPGVIERLRRAVPDADVLIADDNSPDGTGLLADELAAHDSHYYRGAIESRYRHFGPGHHLLSRGVCDTHCDWPDGDADCSSRSRRRVRRLDGFYRWRRWLSADLDDLFVCRVG